MQNGKLAALSATLLCAGCAAYQGAGYDVSAFGASPSPIGIEAPVGGASRVVNGPGGTSYVFRDSNGETDIVHPDGSVTTVIRDGDGTRTVVGPSGVHIDAPRSHHHDRR